MLNKKRPIYKVADLKGLKMRAPVPVYGEMFNALGASGTIVTWTEVYTALQTGVVDGMEASPSLIYAMKFHEQAKYLRRLLTSVQIFISSRGRSGLRSYQRSPRQIH